MAVKIRTLLRLYRVYARMDVLWFLRDTRYCLLQMAADVVSAAACVSGVFLLASRFDGLGGMSRAEVLFLLGYADDRGRPVHAVVCEQQHRPDQPHHRARSARPLRAAARSHLDTAALLWLCARLWVQHAAVRGGADRLRRARPAAFA